MKSKLFILTFFLALFTTIKSYATYTVSGTATVAEQRDHYIRYTCPYSTAYCWERYDDGTIKVFTLVVLTIPPSSSNVITVNGEPFDIDEVYSGTDVFEITW